MSWTSVISQPQPEVTWNVCTSLERVRDYKEHWFLMTRGFLLPTYSIPYLIRHVSIIIMFGEVTFIWTSVSGGCYNLFQCWGRWMYPSSPSPIIPWLGFLVPWVKRKQSCLEAGGEALCIDWSSQSPGGGPAWRPEFISEQLFFVFVNTDLTNEIKNSHRSFDTFNNSSLIVRSFRV